MQKISNLCVGEASEIILRDDRPEWRSVQARKAEPPPNAPYAPKMPRVGARPSRDAITNCCNSLYFGKVSCSISARGMTRCGPSVGATPAPESDESNKPKGDDKP